MIHCIGDSHSSVFSGREDMIEIYPVKSHNLLTHFKAYRIGAATAYQLETKKEIIDSILKENYKDGDKILFCFGEVDCRAHIIKQSMKQCCEIESVVSECVSRYSKVILDYKNNGYDVVVWGVIPSWSDNKKYTGPTYGSNVERNIVTIKFNSFLNKFCIEQNIKFVSVFNEFVNKDLTTNDIYLDDWAGCHIHLNQKAMPLIIEKFKNVGLI